MLVPPMDTSEILIQTIVFAIVAGILMQVLAEKIKMPSIVFLMIAGIALGPEFLNIVQPKVMGSGLEVLVSLAVGLILFEGGLGLDFKAFKEVNQSVRNLLTIGLTVTVVGSAITIHYLLGVDWYLSALFGSFMSITGLTVINPILQRVTVKREISTILRSEGILSNPIGAFLSVGVMEVILASNQQSLVYFAYAFLVKICVGLLVGFIMGWALGKLMKRRMVEGDLKNLVVFAWVFATFYFSNQVESNTGILAVVVAGFALQRENIPQLTTLKKFKGQLSIFFISLLFILISANLQLDQLHELGPAGLGVVAVLVFVVRPLSVFLSNHGLLGFREKLFVSWIGPKGIVSASVASLFSIILQKNGVVEAATVEAMVFLTIMLTVTVQGMSARKAAKLCGCFEEDGGIVIIGANALGRTLGTAFKELGKHVVVIDSNQEHCRLSEEDGLETVHGNALDTNVLESANITRASVLIATTANAEINLLACQQVKDLYRVNEVYPAIDSPHKGANLQLVDDIGGNLAYAKPVSIQEWKDAVDEDRVRIKDTKLEGKGGMLNELLLPGLEDENWIPLILKRKDGYYFVHADQLWSAGDILIYLTK